jgi:glycosyltransferase involved in cell wall biosynthesis
MRKRTILCFTSYYLPGFKNGGPVRSLLNMCQWLGEEYCFRVATRDRDRGDTQPYAGRAPEVWHPVDGAQVWYLPAPYWSPSRLRRVVTETSPDLLYFHSSLEPALTIMPLVLRRLGLLPRTIPVLVAPRGEFSPGALSLKRTKKRAYLEAAKWLGLYRDVMWHATSPEEERLIRVWWGGDARVGTAGNLPARASKAGAGCRAPKQAGTLRLVFLSRISPKKNLSTVLKILAEVKVRVTFDIHGPTEDTGYWHTCQNLIAKLPHNIEVGYKGFVSPDDVVPTLSRYDVFVFPTLGENFGHVIFEALMAGCPVLLSDQTPWRNLSENKAGFDLPLDRHDLFRESIERFAAMDENEFKTWSDSSRLYAQNRINIDALLTENRNMFAQATTTSF